MTNAFDPDCRQCPRLADFLDDVRETHPDYHAAPVAPFGDGDAPLLVVGLAPGMHGANASGRPFTGDHAGILAQFGQQTCRLGDAAGTMVFEGSGYHEASSSLFRSSGSPACLAATSRPVRPNG